MKKINKIIEYGLCLLVFFMPFQTRWIIKLGESEYSTISLYGTDILLVALLFLFAFLYFKTKKLEIGNWKLGEDIKCDGSIATKPYESEAQAVKNDLQRGSTALSGLWSQQNKFPISSIWWLIAGLELMIFISIFFAEDKTIAVYKYGLFLLGIGLFWLIIGASYNKLKLLYCFLAGIFLQACLGIWQFLTQSSFACKWLGMAEHNAGELGTSVIETLAGGRWLRAYGGLDHPNVLGGLLVVGFLFVVAIVMTNHKFKITNNKQITNSKSQIQNIILLFIICYLLSALFFTFSRGAWIGLAVGILIMLFIAVIKKNLLAQKKLLQIILASSVLVFVLFGQFQDLVLTRLSNNARLEIKSNSERIELYKDSWEMIKDNWLFGVGIGNYVSEIETQGDKLPIGSLSPYIQPVHNVFLLVWAEIGIVGLLFFIALLLCVMRQFCLFCRQTDRVMRYALCAALAAMFMIDHWWWSLHFGVLLFWLVVGFIIKREVVAEKT